MKNLNRIAGITIAMSLLSLIIAAVYLLVIALIMRRSTVGDAELSWLTCTTFALIFGCLLKIAAHPKEVRDFIKWFIS